MKRFLSFLLVLVMLSTLTVGAFADSSFVKDGNVIYSESSNVVEGDLYNELLAFFAASDYDSLVSSAVQKNVRVSSLYRVAVNSYTVDEESISLMLDGKAVTKDSTETVSLSKGSHKVSISFKYSAEYSVVGKISGKVSSTGTNAGTASGGAKSFSFEVRLMTTLKLRRTATSLNWGSVEDPGAAVIKALQPTVTLADGTVVTEPAVVIVEDVAALNAGTHTITVKYPGKASVGDEPGYMPATATATLTINKSSTEIDVIDSNFTYDGKEHAIEVVVDPDTVPYTAIIVGIQGNAEGFASFYMSEGNALYDALIWLRNAGDTLNYFTKLIGFDISEFVVGSQGVSLAQLRSILSNITKLSGVLSSLGGIDLDDAQISGILNALEAVEKIMPDINARIYIGNMPKNEGVYGIYAVATDENHQTAMDFGYATIAPTLAAQVKWNKSLSGESFTRHNVGDFDFGGYVVTVPSDDSEPVVLKDVALSYSYSGITADGKLYSSRELPTVPGSYTETAASLYNYVTAGVRAFTIARDPAVVKFVDADGQLVDTITCDVNVGGQTDNFKAVVLDANTNEVIEDAAVTFSYTAGGRSSATAPTASGTYTVKASFAGNALYAPASNNGGTLNINKLKASITFENTKTRILQKVDYKNIGYTYKGMSAEEAAQIAATLGCKSKIHLLIGTHNYTYSIPAEIAAIYDVTVTGKHTVKLFG